MKNIHPLHFVISFLVIVFVVLITLTGILFFKQTAYSNHESPEIIKTHLKAKKPIPKTVPEYIEYVLNQPLKTKILFTGDIMLGRHVETLMNYHGVDYPFERIDPELQSADLVVANLEGPIPKIHKQTPNNNTQFSFLPRTAQVLFNHNIKSVSLANNHTYDYGSSNYINTVDTLSHSSISSFGHTRNAEITHISTTTINNVDLAFVGFNDVFKILDREMAKEVVTLTKKTTNAFVVVNIHWGDEYKLSSNDRQRAIAEELIDAGADLIIGHHPHVTQQVDIYKNKLIFYSLGNFIFDQYFSVHTQQGLLLDLTFDEGEQIYTLKPIQSVRSQPGIMNLNDKKYFLDELAKRSHKDLQEHIREGIITTHLEL